MTAEVHIYPHGSHGLSLCNELTDTCDPKLNAPYCAGWFDLAVRFLRGMGEAVTGRHTRPSAFLPSRSAAPG